jgi:hypothetical protein
MTRGLGAVVWRVKDIEVRGTTLSLGVALVLLTLAISSKVPTRWTRFPRAISHVVYAVSFAGFGLYAASGILSIVHNGFVGRYITVILTVGFPDGFSSWLVSLIIDHYIVHFCNLTTNFGILQARRALFAEIFWIMGLSRGGRCCWFWRMGRFV